MQDAKLNCDACVDSNSEGLCAQEDCLYIAMAGQHQIWRHDLASGATATVSGDGYERNANGATGPSTSWAQVSAQHLCTASFGPCSHVAQI